MTESYSKAKITVPPSYYLPFCHRNTLADLQGYREASKVNMGDAMTHAKKFGIPFSKFSMSKLSSREILRSNMYKDQDVIAIFNILPFSYTWKTGPTVKTRQHANILSGANLTTDYTNMIYVFDDSQEMSLVHALFPIFGLAYDVTNNPYGEILMCVPTAATEYMSNLLHMKILGTSWTQGLMTGLVDLHILKLHMSFWATSTDYSLKWHGDEVTSALYSLTVYQWQAFDENPNLCLDTGHVKGAEAIDACSYAFIYMLYGD